MLWGFSVSDLLIGWLLGLCTCSLVFPWIARRYLKNKRRLRQIISEMYHKDLLPDVCRVEGLLNLELMEFQANKDLKELYIEMALKTLRRHKQHIVNLIKKYEPYQ